MRFSLANAATFYQREGVRRTKANIDWSIYSCRSIILHYHPITRIHNSELRTMCVDGGHPHPKWHYDNRVNYAWDKCNTEWLGEHGSHIRTSTAINLRRLRYCAFEFNVINDRIDGDDINCERGLASSYGGQVGRQQQCAKHPQQ